MIFFYLMELFFFNRDKVFHSNKERIFEFNTVKGYTLYVDTKLVSGMQNKTPYECWIGFPYVCLLNCLGIGTNNKLSFYFTPIYQCQIMPAQIWEDKTVNLNFSSVSTYSIFINISISLCKLALLENSVIVHCHAKHFFKITVIQCAF